MIIKENKIIFKIIGKRIYPKKIEIHTINIDINIIKKHVIKKNLFF